MPSAYRCKANNMPTELQTNFRSHAYIDTGFFSAMHHWTRTVAKKSSIGGLYVCAGGLDVCAGKA